MKNKIIRKAFVLLSALSMLLTVSCSSDRAVKTDGVSRNESSIKEDFQQETPQKEDTRKEDSSKESSADSGEQGFAKAHDAFETTLAREENDDDPIPDPPEGVFDLVYYPSKVGDLAAYVSSDPGDGQKHPMIIWVVGGWGNGIDDFPWTYPEWDNDQTGSAFWQAGILTMYPSFRGGNGNPGHYEALFGEVDDIASAYEYAASLPYVDPDRIYLGGHSTGGTRALLAAEYTDKFRTVFCFGAVDEVKYHNNSQFTFDTDNEDEFTMRSPIHWLDDVKTPTFLIEGSDGNSSNLKNIERTSENDNIHCYIIQGEDHFSVLAPVTRLLAQKILEDTGAEPGISITQEELEEAMDQDPVVPLPVMTSYTIEEAGLSFSYPYLWEVEDISENGEISLGIMSPYEEENVWDLTTLYIDAYEADPSMGPDDVAKSLEIEEGYNTSKVTINGLDAVIGVGTLDDDEGSTYKNTYVVVFKDDAWVTFDLYIHVDFDEDSEELFQTIIDSIAAE